MIWDTAYITILIKRAESKDGDGRAELLNGGGLLVGEGADVEGIIITTICAVKKTI